MTRARFGRPPEAIIPRPQWRPDGRSPRRRRTSCASSVAACGLRQVLRALNSYPRDGVERPSLGASYVDLGTNLKYRSSIAKSGKTCCRFCGLISQNWSFPSMTRVEAMELIDFSQFARRRAEQAAQAARNSVGAEVPFSTVGRTSTPSGRSNRGASLEQLTARPPIFGMISSSVSPIRRIACAGIEISLARRTRGQAGGPTAWTCRGGE